jgi:hypothetical protein
MKSKTNCKLCWCIVAVGVLSALGLVAFVGDAWRKVASGHGLDTYFTGWGVQFNYVGLLVLIAVIPFALLLSYAVRYWELRHERELMKRYGFRDNHA